MELTWDAANNPVHMWRHYKGEYSGHFVNEQDAIDNAWLAFPLIQRKMNNANVMQKYQLKGKK
jgi:hypothetical protein